MWLRKVAGLLLLGFATLAFAQTPTGKNTSLPRPLVDDRVQALGAALLDAVVHDDPSRADAQFFPRDAFLQVKAMENPGRYWDRLHARFADDVHALHSGIKGVERAQFDRLELARRGGLVQPGEEGNRLPYWASRHSRLHFRIDKVAQSFEVRVVISWENRWYLIHLSEFHNPARG